jgi:Cys-rich protein (TIGR01571 family)
MDYNILNKGEWKTHLCHCDTESCFLSLIVPCHVYAKIKSFNKSQYCIHLIIYLSIYLSVQQLWVSQKYINDQTCPKHITQDCISIQDDCVNYYVSIDSILYSCIEKNGYCISDKYECIDHELSNKISTNIFLLSSFFYFFLCLIHYCARETIKTKNIIETNIFEDIVAISCCPTCGLAQEYREL